MTLFLKNRFMVSTIAFGLLLAALVILVVVPSFKKIRLINEQVLEERIRLKKLYTKGQVQKTVQQNFASIKNEVQFLDEMLLKENQELDFITQIEHVAENSGIEIDMSIGKTKRIPEQRFSELEVNYTVNGSWEQFMEWISGIESLPTYTNIHEINVAIHTDDSNELERNAIIGIEANTFWLIPGL